MRQLRSASPPPRSQLEDFSPASTSNRVLRSSHSRSPSKDQPIFFLDVGMNARRHKRNWSSFSSDSNSPSGCGELQLAAQKEYACHKSHARAFQFSTPAASPQTSSSDS